MDEQLLCVLRRPTGLAALVSSRREKLVRPKLVAGDKPESLIEIDPYCEEVRDLERHRGFADLKVSWDSLGRVSALDATALFHVLHVLTCTLPDADAPAVPPLKTTLPPAPFQPTAAHPRAYRGTKDRPPKKKRMAPLDLRPYLCVARDTNQLLLQLAPFLPETRPLLKRVGLSSEEFPCLVNANGTAIDPYLQHWHSAGDRSVYDLPPSFRRHLLASMVRQPWSVLVRALAFYWGLEADARLLRCFARFLATHPPLSCLEWWRILLQQPAQRWPAFAELLIETHVAFREPVERLAETISEVDRLSPDHVYRHRMHTLLDAFRWEANLDYLLDGFRLANRYKLHEFDDCPECNDFSISAVEDFVEHVTESQKTEAQWRSSSALTLWGTCAELDGFNAFLNRRLWKGLEPDVAYEAVHMFWEVIYHDLSEEARQVKWRTLRDFAPRLFELLRSIEPQYREKAVCYLRDLAWFWDDPDALACNLERYRRLLPRLCQKPFAQKAIPDALTVLTHLGPQEWEELASSDDRSFLKLERECRRENDARLISRGLEVVAETAGAWTVRAFRECPSHLFRSGHVLGCMGETARQEVVQSWLAHPLLALDAEATPANRLVQEIERQRPAGVHNPIPRKLHAAAMRMRQLKPGQVNRALAAVREELPATRVDLLRRLALDRLARTIGPAPDTAEGRHAVCLQGSIRDNRRALRRFLRAYFAGNHNYLIDHPINRGWLARHARIDTETWLRGIQRRATLSDSSKLHLAVEQNPLEVLRLGTHVGTCLGLGGNLAYSAAAVVLDINKHVVYARDSSGAVLGRQLLALSEDDRLVCFHVYPLEARADIKKSFLDYNRALAEVLQVEIHDPKTNEDGYKIDHLLSSGWWDDDAWDGGKK